MEDERPDYFDNVERKKQDEKIEGLKRELIEAEMNKWVQFAFVEELLNTLVFGVNMTHADANSGKKIAEELTKRLEDGQIKVDDKDFTENSKEDFMNALKMGRKKISETRDNLFAISRDADILQSGEGGINQAEVIEGIAIVSGDGEGALITGGSRHHIGARPGNYSPRGTAWSHQGGAGAKGWV